MSVCEVCGRPDEEESRSADSGIEMGILHVCEACRADRQAEMTTEIGLTDSSASFAGE